MGAVERGGAEPVAWWRAPEVRRELEHALRALNDRGDASPENAFDVLAASLDGLLGAARSIDAFVGGSLREPQAVLKAEAALETGTKGALADLDRLERALDALLDFPSHKLAIYGSLAPGEINYHVIESIRGSWQDGFVRGHVANVGWGADYGFPALTWDAKGPEVSVKLLVSSELPKHWERIDRFEGDGYQRIVIPVDSVSGVVAIANIYAARA